MIQFQTRYKFDKEIDGRDELREWTVKVTDFKSWGSHYTFIVEAAGSGIRVITGPHNSGWFITILDWRVSASYRDPSDTFLVFERLTSVMGPVDAKSVSSAISALYENGMF